jgi:hypothetical protein
MKEAELHAVNVVATPVAVEVTGSAIDPSAPPPYSAQGIKPRIKPTSLVGLVDILKGELELDGTMQEVVDRASQMVGVLFTDGNLIERASLCYDQLFKGSDQARALERLGTTDFTMSDKSWEAGQAGEGWESFGNNPWSFKKDGTVVAERDGCKGYFSLTPSMDAPGGMKLRIDWDSQQGGAWIEFKMGRPDSDPLFICCDAAFGMRRWDIREVPPSQVKRASKARTYIIPPILRPVVMRRTDAMSQRALAEMRKVAAAHDEQNGPHPHQKHSFLWFDNHSNWKTKYPVHRAALRGDVEALAVLLQEGQDVNRSMTEWNNMQPLGLAAIYNQVHAIVLLVEYGADTEFVSAIGSAADLAERYGHQGAGVALDTFKSVSCGGDHAGKGTRKLEHENNWARVAFPIAGHPLAGADMGAYTDSLGCCCFVTDRRENVAGDCEIGSFLLGGLLIAAWAGTLCYQPCGWMQGHWVWFGDCPCSEQRVTHSFVESHPSKVTRGPAKYRFDNGIPTRYTHY